MGEKKEIKKAMTEKFEKEIKEIKKTQIFDGAMQMSKSTFSLIRMSNTLQELEKNPINVHEFEVELLSKEISIKLQILEIGIQNTNHQEKYIKEQLKIEEDELNRLHYVEEEIRKSMRMLDQPNKEKKRLSQKLFQIKKKKKKK